MTTVAPLAPEGLKQIPAAHLVAGGARSREKARGRLKQACQEFEALFLTQLIKRMRATVPGGGFLGESRERRLFSELLDEQLAARFAQGGQTGLAEAMYRQIASRLFPAQEGAVGPTSQEPPGAKASGRRCRRD